MKVLLSKINYQRKKQFLIRTSIIQENESLYVEKKAWGDEAWNVLIDSEKFYRNYSKKLPAHVKLAKFLQKNIQEKTVKYEFIKGEIVRSRIERLLIERKFHQARDLYRILNDVMGFFTSKTKGDELKGFRHFIKDCKYKIPDAVFNEAVPLTELSHEHLILSGKDIFLIDYENFLNFYFPARFVKFRSELYFLLTFQQIIRSLGGKRFVLTTYWKDLYIPKEWVEINDFKLNEKKAFLFIEEKIQNHLHNAKSNISKLHLTSYKEEDVDRRISQRLTVESQRAFENLKDLKKTKIFYLWRFYRKLREFF